MPTSFPTYVINLDRRPDRLAAVTRAMSELGLPFERVSAVDGAAASFAETAAGYERRGPLGQIGNGTLACSLSHKCVWQRMLAAGDDYAFVLEDDVQLAPRTPAFLEAFAAAAPPIDLLKLERKKNERGLFVGKKSLDIEDVEVVRLHSLHAGSAAYIISRRGAEIALAKFSSIMMPIDHFLFNPGKGSASQAIGPYQVFPALARQHRDIGGGSDIGERTNTAKRHGSRLAYHLRRTLYEAPAYLGCVARTATRELQVRRLSFDGA